MSSPIRPPLTVKTIDGTTEGRPINTIRVTNGDLSISGTVATIDTSGSGGGSGTVTSVGTSQAFITIADPTTTPSISIGNASGAATGVLTATNFNTFDAKQDAITLTTTGTSGAATFAGGTLNIPQYSGTTGTVTGTGTSGQVSYWNGTSSQTGSANLTFDGTNLKVGGYVEVGTKITTPTGTDLTLDTVNGTDSGSIVIEDGVDGQISITPNGAGTIKLDGVELDNSAIATGYVLKATSATAAGWAAESGGGGGTIGGSITDNKVAVGASTADDIEGYTDFTYNDSTDTLTVGEKIDSSGTSPLLLQAGSSVISVLDGGVPNHINITPASGLINIDAETIRLSTTGNSTITTANAVDLILNTNDGTNSGSIVIEDGVDGQISITPNGAGTIKLDGVELDNSAIATGYVLKATSATAAGWAAESGGGGSPGGSDTELQYNDGGSFGGISSVTFNDTSNYLTIDPTRTIIGAGPAFDSGLTVTDDTNFRNSQTKFADGTEAAPSITFWNNGDDDTGIYRPAPDAIGFTVGGNERMRIQNGAVEGIIFRVNGTDTAANPGFAFDPDNDTGTFSVASNTLSFSTGGTERLRIGSSGEILIGGTAAGDSGQVLTSGGSGAAVSWAAAGGTKRNYQGLLTPFSTSVKTWDITRQTPFSSGSNGSTQFGALFNNSGIAFCFSAPQSGTPTEIGVVFGSSSSGGINFAIYDSNADGTPNQLIAEGTAAYSASSVVYDTSLTGQSGGSVGEMVAGELMWCVMTRTDGSVATVMQCSNSGTRGKSAPESTVGGSAGNCIETTSFNASTSFTNTAPAITSWGSQNTLIPIIGVRF